jgi:hypothetical protein
VFFPLNAKQHRRAAGLEEVDHVMIVIERDGKSVVVTTTAVLAALAFLILGIAVSMIAFLLIVMPTVAIAALSNRGERDRRRPRVPRLMKLYRGNFALNRPSRCIDSRSRVRRRPLIEGHLSPPSTKVGGGF